jgi:O-antigen ligase
VSFLKNIVQKLKENNFIPIVVSILLMALVVFFIRRNQFAYAGVIPLVIVGLYWAIFKIDYLLLIVAATIPISTSLEQLKIYNPLGFEVSLPSEPIMVFLLGISIYKFIFYFDWFKGLRKHPIFLSILFYIFTMVLAIFTSTLPLVAIKATISKWWFIFPSIILGFHFFQKERNIYRFFLLLSLSASAVVIYSIFGLFAKGFELHYAHFVMQPFYKDHTVYGASITFIAFFSVFSVFNKRLSDITRLAFAFTSLVLVAGIIYSFTRAAWVSIVFAIGVYVLMRLKIKFWVLSTTILIIGTFLFSFWNEIFFALNKNSQDSSGNFTEHISSMTNISTDASNLERLNRWFCALELWKEKPITGWGPGTYQFEYGAYQKSYSRSLISTNDGNMGNAHSEYLGAMAESGVIGLLGLFVLLYSIFHTSIKLYHRTTDSSTKALLLSLILGLASYFMHGILNNYLDTIKVAVFVWISVSIIIVLHHKEKKNNETLDYSQKTI